MCTMNIIDTIVICLLFYFGFMGLRRGFTKELVSFVGVFAILIIAFLLKNPISQLMYENLPFFSFGGMFKGITALNILVYEAIAFLLVVALLGIVFKVLLFATSVFEKILKFTIVLGIPSKILGMFVGFVEGLTWVFLLLYILSLPVFSLSSSVRKSHTAPIILHIPILSHFTKDVTNAIDECMELKEEYEKSDNTEEYNYRTMEVLLKYKVIKVESALKLKEKGKLKIKNIDQLIEKYKEANDGKIK